MTTDVLEYHPRKFAHPQTRKRNGDWEAFRATRERSHRELDAMRKRAERLTPSDAVSLAQTLLVHVEAAGIDYGDFQSAQAVERYVKRAISALRGLSLS